MRTSLWSRPTIAAALFTSCLLGIGVLPAVAHLSHVETEQIQLRAPHPDQTALEAAFTNAAVQYKVPVEILRAVAFVESRWVHTGPTVDYGYGIMHLVNNNNAATLSEAAELTGRSIEDLKLDPIANINGGAALIAHYVKKTVGTAEDWLDYREALKRFSGLDESIQDKQVLEYLNVLANGASGGNILGMDIQLTAVNGLDLSSLRAEIATRDVASDDYGPAIWNAAASCNYTSGRQGSGIDRWVNHWVGSGTYAGCISWFKNCNASTSSHFVVRQSDGEITQMVSIGNTAWHAGNWNYNIRSIGVEHEATPSYSWPQNADAPIIVKSAECCRHFCNVYGIPKTRAYILGHNEIVSTACPGNLPWDAYMNAVNGVPVIINPPYTFDNDLQGWSGGNCYNGPYFSNTGGWPGILYLDQTCNDAFIYSPSTNFTGQANQAMAVRIYCPNTSQHDMQLFWTSAANPNWSEANSSGVVSYSAPTGWTVVALPLNTGNWINQNITRLRLDFDQGNSGQRWHVDSLTFIANKGNLTGTVTSAATSSPLAGASVTLAGVGSTTTNASGVYTFSNVTSGTYTVSVSATSYTPASASVAITAGATTTRNFALAVSDLEAPTQPANLVLSPGSGSSVQLSWSASTDNIAVTGYEIRRDGATIGSSTTTSYTDATATAQTAHVYEVRAKDAVLNYSAWSESATVDRVPPSQPTLLAAVASSSSSVQLTWVASTDDVAVTGYEIRRDGIVIGSSVTAGYSDDTTAANTHYTYEVRAKDAWLNYSAWSDSAELITPYAPGVVFQDGFDGDLSNWTQGAQSFVYSTTMNHAEFSGDGAAYMGAGQSDQMYHRFARPFAQGTIKGCFWDGRGGWQQGVCGWAYRQALSLRDADGASKMCIDNGFYSAGGIGNYFYRMLDEAGGAHTAYATRDAATDCSGAWISFQTSVMPAAAGSSVPGTFTVTVTDRAGSTSTTQDLSSDFFSWGFARIHLGLGNSSANEGYWDDIILEATPPATPVMGQPTAVGQDSICWNFAPADNYHFGYDVVDAEGAIVSPAWPAAGWIGHNALSWTEGGLLPNTLYSRKVKNWNGTLNSQLSQVASARTLSAAPTPDSIVASTSTPCAAPDLAENVIWTAVGGFGPGTVDHYLYAWDTNPTYSFTGSEAVWSASTLAVSASSPGIWYLHVQGYNADNVPNGSLDYSVTAGDCSPPVLATAVSRKAHGGQSFDLDVALNDAVECRAGGPTQIIVTFESAIERLDSVTFGDVQVNSGTVSDLSITGEQLTVTLSGVTDASRFIMTFPGIVRPGGTTGSTSTLCFSVLGGDITGDGSTNVFDLVAVRNELNTPVSASNHRCDVTGDGTINVFDLVQTRNHLNASIVDDCPSAKGKGL